MVSGARSVYGIRQRGATLIEMVLVIGLFLMIVFGIIEFGRAVWNYNTLSYAVREGSRFAIVNGSGTGTPAATESLIKQRVIASGTGLNLQASQIQVAYTPSGDNSPGSSVTVTATYPFVPATPYVGSINMTNHSTQVILH